MFATHCGTAKKIKYFCFIKKKLLRHKPEIITSGSLSGDKYSHTEIKNKLSLWEYYTNLSY